jgi:hypothetical protein
MLLGLGSVSSPRSPLQRKARLVNGWVKPGVARTPGTVTVPLISDSWFSLSRYETCRLSNTMGNP